MLSLFLNTSFFPLSNSECECDHSLFLCMFVVGIERLLILQVDSVSSHIAKVIECLSIFSDRALGSLMYNMSVKGESLTPFFLY